MKRFLSAILVVLMIASFASTCLAEVEPRASELFASRSISTSTPGGGTVNFSVYVTGNQILDKLGFKILKVKEYYNGAWSTVKILRNKYDYDTIAHGYYVSYDGVAGRQYHLYAEAYAELGSSSDTKKWNSTNVTAK